MSIADLRAAFAALEERAPTELPPDRLPGRPSTRGQSGGANLRRWVVPLAAAAALVTATGGTWLATSALRSPSPPAEGTRVPTTTVPTELRFSFDVASVPGYRVQLAQIQPELQRADVTVGTSDLICGAVYVFPAGGFDPTEALRGKPIRVGDRAGYFAPLTSPSLLDNRTVKPAVLDSVAWQYRPNAWAMVQLDWGLIPTELSNPLARGHTVEADELRIAAAVKTGQSTAMRLPFRVGYLPAGVYPVSANQSPELQGGALGLADGRPTAKDVPRLPSEPFYTPLTIWVADMTDPQNRLCPAFGKEARPFTVDGRTGCLETDPATGLTYGLQIDLPRGHLEITVERRHWGIYTDRQLERIVASITPATNLSDRTTWPDATTVFPT